MELNGEVHYTDSKSPVDEEDEFALEIAHLRDDNEPVSVDNQAKQAHTHSTEPDGEGPETHDASSIHSNVLEILEEKWEEWKRSKQADQKRCWKQLVLRLRTMEIHQTLEQPVWITRQGWLAWTLIAETQKANLTQIRNELAGGSNDIKFYQPALNQLMKGIPAEDLKKAEWTAVEWNLQSSPEEAQARFANKNVPKLIQQFTEQMWRKGSIRLAILSGWKNQEGEIFSQKYDFNAQFADGAAFEPLDEGKANRSSEDVADVEGSNKGRAKPKPKSRDQLIASVTDADGRIWIPDITEAGRAELQGLIVIGLVCGKKRASAPFKKLGGFQDWLFKKTHLPPNFIFPDDPSDMKAVQARVFLDFIQRRQQKFPNDVFSFRYWLNDNDELTDPVGASLDRSDSSDDDSSDGDDLITISDDAAEVEEDLLPAIGSTKGKEKMATSPRPIHPSGEQGESSEDDDLNGTSDNAAVVEEDLLPVIGSRKKTQKSTAGPVLICSSGQKSNHITQLESHKANLTSHKSKGRELKKALIALLKAVASLKPTTHTQRLTPWPTHGVPGTRNGAEISTSRTDDRQPQPQPTQMDWVSNQVLRLALKKPKPTAINEED
ncbi:hypothetical protein V8E55_011853 [Tylopilus felleus]